MPPTSLGLLESLLASQAEALSTELQAMFAARLEELFQPLRVLVAGVQVWTDKVSSLLGILEVVGGSLDLANSLGPSEHDVSDPPVMAGGKEVSVDGEAGCSSELIGGPVQPVDVSPGLGLVLPERVILGVEEQAKVDEIVTSCDDMVLAASALPISTVGEVPPSVFSPELNMPGDPHSLKVSVTDKPFGVHGVPVGPTSSTLLDEYLSSFNCTAPLSLLDAPIHVQIEGESTCVGRRSGRLDKKNKDCNIPTAKRAEYRLAEAFGELPKDAISKKGSEEEVQEKMNSYARLCKQPASPTALQAIRELVQVNV